MTLNAIAPTAAALTPIPTFSPFESPPSSDAAVVLEALFPAEEIVEVVAADVVVDVELAESVRCDDAAVESLVVGAGSGSVVVEELDDVPVTTKLDAVES